MLEGLEQGEWAVVSGIFQRQGKHQEARKDYLRGKKR